MTSIIIPVYIANIKLLDVADRCLRSLEATIKGEYEVITVNDASPIPYEATISHEVNTGFTKAVNDGIRAATGDTLVIAGDDLEFVEDWQKALLPLLIDPNVGVASLPTNDEETPINGGIIDEAKFGSIFAVRKDVFDSVGLLDESMPHYFSDLDFYTRVKEAGLRRVKNTGLILPHVGNGTYKIVDPKGDRYYKDMEAYRKKWGRVD
jgi:GT2 family glycosyltransferase